MGIVLENPGLLTTIQDEGRYGFQQFGVSPAGPMDKKAFALANILVGNDRKEAALEITFSGPVMRFEEDTIIAVTGGDFAPQLNGTPIPMCQAVGVRKGDRLALGMVRNGCRGYIAFAGGLDVPLVMNSRSTLIRNQLGGYRGRKLEREDRIRFLNPKTELPGMVKRKLRREAYPTKEIVLRVVTGPQDDAFSEAELKKFFWYSARITNESDRMGCRLEREEPLKHITDGNIITDGISFGSIQVPTNGQPIIMLADRQSTGGYTKIGTVISVDLPKIAQSIPGYRVRFVRVSIELAQELYIRQLKELELLEKQLNTAC